ncbi:hypothetical protein F5B21DRAFT_245876 [Xylaria acuta]|nr:hypothetical protein F5B21DRAFT_245876 [Xylaria acuta]
MGGNQSSHLPIALALLLLLLLFYIRPHLSLHSPSTPAPPSSFYHHTTNRVPTYTTQISHLHGPVQPSHLLHSSNSIIGVRSIHNPTSGRGRDRHWTATAAARQSPHSQSSPASQTRPSCYRDLPPAHCVGFSLFLSHSRFSQFSERRRRAPEHPPHRLGTAQQSTAQHSVAYLTEPRKVPHHTAVGHRQALQIASHIIRSLVSSSSLNHASAMCCCISSS